MSTSLPKKLKKTFPIIPNDMIFQRTFNLDGTKSQKLIKVKNKINTASLTSLNTEFNANSNQASYFFSDFNSRNTFFDNKINFLSNQERNLSKKSTFSNITDMNHHVLLTSIDPRKEVAKKVLRKKRILNTHYKSHTSYSINKNESFIPMKTDINLVDFDSIVKYSHLISKEISKNNSPIKNEKSKNYCKTPLNNFAKKCKNYKFSLSYLLGKNLIVDENNIDNKYKPNLCDFLGDKEYLNYCKKNKKLVKSKEEIINVCKDVKLMESMVGYLNTSLSKLYNQKRAKIKKLKNEKEKLKIRNMYNKSINSKLKQKMIPIDKLCKVRKYFNQNKKEQSKKNSVKILYKNGFLSKSILKPEYTLNLKKNLLTNYQKILNNLE